MNKQEFIKQLKIKLKKLPQDELDNAIEYYTEYFDDANIDDNVDVTKELGTPSQIASQIFADYAVKDKPSKNNISSIWFIILAIFAAPIALPLTFAAIIIIGSLAFAGFMLIAALGITVLAIAFTGVVVFISSFSIISKTFAGALLIMGIGCALAGISILCVNVILSLFNWFIKLIVKLANSIIMRFSKKSN
ncbi:DUF1700 domain-containing protein [Terrisporobacter petrolearius]|uniref:DUF1700 domain-containing protein n=1 Tax=Terrisporobacter petrolearius TaxID=1460447 RepID=UPI0031CCBBB0